MSVYERLVEQRRVILGTAVLVSLIGIVAATTMPRQEDPQIPDHWGLVVTMFPGADAEKVERLVVHPLEEHLAEVHEIKHVVTTIRSGTAITLVELRFPLDDVNHAWDEVRRSLAKAKREFPESAGEPILDEKLQDHESVVLAVSGPMDPVTLADIAEAMKKEFLSLRDVSRVKVIADPGEQITIEFDDSVLRRLGVDPLLLKGQLSARNLTIPGGSIKLGGKKIVLRLNDEFESAKDIASTPIVLPSGAGIPLGELAKVRRGPDEPASVKMRFDGKSAIGLGIIPRKGINVVGFGETVRKKVEELRSRYPEVEIGETAFQPDRVRARLLNLGSSLLLSVMTVGGVLLLFMGLRLGLIVASIVPMVGLTSLAIYYWGGGVLQQISIAAFVIALGMLVDNAIVVSESVQGLIDQGLDPKRAAIQVIRELALPLAAATGTTLAAFLPMLLAQSVTGEFTRALPVIIMVTLTVSYVFAVSVTAILSSSFLKRSTETKESRFRELGAFLGRLSLNHYGAILIAAGLLVAGSLGATGFVDRRFFPGSDRNQLIVELKLPEGAHLSEIDAAAAKVEAKLTARPDVVSVAAFIGRSAPQFYYNLPRLPESPHLAQIVVTTVDNESVEPVIRWSREYVRNELPEAEVVGRRLQQGPPLDAPFEVRVLGWDLADLSTAADMVMAGLKSIPQAADVRHNMGVGVPTIHFRIDDAAAARHGLSRSDVALAVQGRVRGLEVGKFRAGEDPVPILIRSKAGENYPAEDLHSIDVATTGGKPVPLAQLARSDIEWLPAVIHHRNGKRAVTVSAQLAEGATYSRILKALKPKIAAMNLPKGVYVEYGGEAESSDEANAGMFKALPVALVVLIVILLVEFNSFRRVAIILVTVPLAATGVVPGLLISGEAFGFMSLLGIFSLAGVVVNNAIVLIDRIEICRSMGADLSQAIAEAVTMRTRPILLTTATTVFGLLPLALSTSNLWPPLAWAMISGLTASTGLTLLVVPSLYRVMCAREVTRQLEAAT
ncbi:MAG: efflux RND transporter permease subunit [Desulfomonilaceae bacterium]|nr:efflux RND transporter permease subunit [Desulfomonilaceae bacterium]